MTSPSGRNPTGSYEQRLLAIAGRCAEALGARHSPAALVLYGSLAHGGVNEFSDVDIAVIAPGALPEYRVEHRLVDDVKVDVIFDQLAWVSDLVPHMPRSLTEGHQIHWQLLESLLLGPERTLLYDPTGEIHRVRHELRQMTRYEQLALPSARDDYQRILTEEFAPALEQMEREEWFYLLERARAIAERFCFTLRILSGIKDTVAAARKHGIPEFPEIVTEVQHLCSPSTEAAQAVWLAVRSLWDYALQKDYRPILERLAQAGVKEPETLEFVGTYEFFWTGRRLTELGRVVFDVEEALQRSRVEFYPGNITDVLRMLRKCGNVTAITRLWQGIASGLSVAGYDLSGTIQSLLDDAEFRQRAAVVDRTGQAFALTAASWAGAQRAFSLAQELQMLMERALLLNRV